MNCNEVGDLMQRKLDLDLSEAESLKLDLHLASCASCRVLFAGLNLLSSQLEQLPQVTPSISIVDSILPKLLEIDKQKDDAIVKFEDAVSTENTINKDHKILTRRWILTATSGLVAAAAILFFINLNGLNTNSNSIADFNFARDTSSEQSSQRANPEIIESLTFSGEDHSGDPISNEEKPSTSQTTKQVDQMKVTTTSENNTESAIGDIVEESPLESSYTAYETEQETMYTTSNTNELIESAHNEEMPFGILKFETPNFTDPSPNNKFYLQLNDHIIMVHDLETNEVIKEIEVPIKGTIHFVGWHEAESEFYIEVVDENLQTHNLTFPVGL